jgi:hypothetical protein
MGMWILDTTAGNCLGSRVLLAVSGALGLIPPHPCSSQKVMNDKSGKKEEFLNMEKAVNNESANLCFHFLFECRVKFHQ